MSEGTGRRDMDDDHGRFHIIVHDYDKSHRDVRVQKLVEVLGDRAEVEGFSERRALLLRIARVPEHDDNQPWPIALIDLQGSNDNLARGQHLLATIHCHPALRGRVSLVAFTRYGSESNDSALLVRGARAVIHPGMVRKGESKLLEAFGMLASGYKPPPLLRVGSPPIGEDLRAVRVLELLFPELKALSTTPEQQWDHAKQIIHICRLFSDGYSVQSIYRIAAPLNWTRKDIDGLRDDLKQSDAAYDPTIFPRAGGVPDLAAAFHAVRPYLGESEAAWIATTPRETLDGAGRLRWATEMATTRDLREHTKNGAWIPPEYLVAFNVFLPECGDLLYGAGGHPSDQKVRELVAEAVDRTASELELDRDETERQIVHTILCLEDYQAEEAARRRQAALTDDPDD
jgi:hypothetical protein